VLIYTAPPEFKVEGYVEAEGGNLADHRLQGALNLPIVADKLAIRVAGDVERRDGFIKDISGANSSIANINSVAGRVSILFKPTDWLSNITVADYYRNDALGSGQRPIGPAVSVQAAAATAALNAAGGFRSVDAGGLHEPETTRTYGVSNTTTVDFGPVTVKNIFGLRGSGLYDFNNGTGLSKLPSVLTGLPVAFGGVPTSVSDGLYAASTRNDEQVSEELQFTGSLLDNTLNWLAGAFYVNDEPTGPENLAEWIVFPNDRKLPPNSIVTKNGIYLVSPQLVNNLYSDQSKAIFGNLTYNLAQISDALSGVTLNAGLRATWDREGVCGNVFNGITNTGQQVVPFFSSQAQCKSSLMTVFSGPGYTTTMPAPQIATASFMAPTHTFGIDWKVNDDLFFYFTTRRGYRAGAVNTPGFPANSPLGSYQTYGSQIVTDYEIGTHVRFKAGAMKGLFNLAAYRGDYTNLQLEAAGVTSASRLITNPVIAFLRLPGNGIYAPANTALFFNAGTSDVEGIEADTSIKPIPDLTLSFGGSYTEAKALLTTPAALQPFTASTIEGTPKWSGTADVRYRLPIETGMGGNFFFDANIYYIDSLYRGLVQVPAYSLTNLSVQWLGIGNGPVDATFFMDNVFDRQFYRNVELTSPSSFGTAAAEPGPPRTFGVRIRYMFGG
jgi:iron complex outermembrane receptor protein